jgi:hypothetical protein
MYSKQSKLCNHVYEVYISLVLEIIFRDNQWGFLKLWVALFHFPARMDAIFPCIKDQGTLEPTRGHFSPLGQQTSPLAPCCLMLCLEQKKQNLCEGTNEHFTKWVCSSCLWQRVQHSGALAPREESGRWAGCTGSSSTVLPVPTGHWAFSLGVEPSLVHRGQRGWAAAVPGPGVHLVGIFQGITVPCIVCC